MNKKLKISVIACIILTIALVLFSNLWVTYSTKGRCYDDVAKVGKNRVALVLGTSKLLRNGRVNLYFKYRIEATLALYKAGKVDFILVSGDNGNVAYDEPTDFKEALVKGGIAEDKIYLDYAGFRTLDSVIRAKKIFGQDKLTVISQKFHNERAIFLARQQGMDAIGFNAQDVTGRYGVRVQVREYFARMKAVLDVCLGVGPKFLGEPIEIK